MARSANSSRSCLLYFLLLMWPLGFRWSGAAEPVSTPVNLNETISSIAGFWTEGLRDQRRPIRLDIHVYYHDPGWGNLWGEVSGASGFIRTAAGLPIRSRTRIRIEGTVIPTMGLRPGEVDVTVIDDDISIVPLPTTGELGNFARFHEKMVVVEGIIQQQELLDSQHLGIELVAEGHRVHLIHWSQRAQLLPLDEGDMVRLTGLYSDKHNSRTGALEVELWVARLDDIVVTGNLLSDPQFNVPLAPIDEITRVAESAAAPIRIAGVVRSVNPGVSITLRDTTGQTIVQSLQRLTVQLGDVVEAVGMPVRGADWLLQAAVIRQASSSVAADVRQTVAASKELRLAEQVLQLTPTEATQGRAVDISGVVIRSRANTGFLFLRDTSATLRIDLGAVDETHLNLKTGAGVRIIGKSAMGSFAPQMIAASVEYWGGALTPEAKPATLEQAMTGQEEGERLEMRGLITDVVIEDPWTHLKLASTTGEFTVHMSRTERWNDAIGSFVSVRGVCQGVADADRQLVGVELWASNESDIRVEQAALTDPFSVPLRKIDALRQFSTRSGDNFWSRIAGIVTYYVPGKFIYVQDGDNSGRNGSGLALCPMGGRVRPVASRFETWRLCCVRPRWTLTGRAWALTRRPWNSARRLRQRTRGAGELRVCVRSSAS